MASKAEKEAFYHGHDGGTSLEIFLITSIAPISVFAQQCIELGLLGSQHSPVSFFRVIMVEMNDLQALYFLLNVIVIVLPLYTSFVLPQHAITLQLILLSIPCLLVVLGRLSIRNASESVKDLQVSLREPRKAYVTSYRGTMMLATCIAILAVDFPSFPRRFAKTETFGVSLMDAGVGSVLLTQAMVSPLARKPTMSAVKRLRAALLSASPLLGIGCVRLLACRASDYHEHVSEYGVHWNFFFTLAFISIFGSLVPVDETLSAISVLAISSGYELLLHRSGLQSYILEAPRTSIFSANREGIMGCVGYTSLFLAGVAMGKRIFAEQRKEQSWQGLWASLSAGSMAFAMLVEVLEGLMLCQFLTVEILVHFLQGPKDGTILKQRRMEKISCQLLCDALNRNLLAIFLLSNLLTGRILLLQGL
ncbi:hypothetical protein GUITHDRAFT_163762 [Guillardia theta CCMP2712]|uniref:Phosphatidylinositol-glycan biosynthesis class W protein n=1 Tax=Guillardia theta (strain CCMP2712) TaxID=905079 RepID=L1J6U9_GUITC|nr:hypothetical protein GUITHDRAFT_163762 [Guillardia theta CCMP2712]EKX43814.1 hypothetical protein GUITHDRAFT_163762 [Guillardia theta CCMP2712]|eukprot:XP_005830794.1 hypothetical protein GUITHDRAFT_163762 [Guillardia theta CCMP2712]